MKSNTSIVALAIIIIIGSTACSTIPSHSDADMRDDTAYDWAFDNESVQETMFWNRPVSGNIFNSSEILSKVPDQFAFANESVEETLFWEAFPKGHNLVDDQRWDNCKSAWNRDHLFDTEAVGEAGFMFACNSRQDESTGRSQTGSR